MGRPSKLTPETQKQICDAVLIGATYEAAAESAGVGYSTFAAWMVNTAKKYLEFQEAVRQANAQARLFLLMNIKQAARGGDWRAAAWILERRFSEEYGQKVKSEITGAGGGALQIEYVNDWRTEANQTADAAFRAKDDSAEQSALQVGERGQTLAENHDGVTPIGRSGDTG